MTYVIRDLRNNMDKAYSQWADLGGDRELGKGDAYRVALEVLAKYYPEMFAAPRPSLASQSL